MGIFTLFASDNKRNIAKLEKMVQKIEELAPKYADMDNDTLRAQTPILKERLANGETLDDILYDAFAVVREASTRVLNMRHFHYQLMGGIVLHQGRIAEMMTGEGKTIVAVTHDVEFAAEIADRCAMYFDGKIVSIADKYEFFSENKYYTTAAARITRDNFRGAVTFERAVKKCNDNRIIENE